MSFDFQVAKFVLNDDRFHQDQIQTQCVAEDYAGVLLEVALQHFAKLNTQDLLPDSVVLMIYLDKIISLKEEIGQSAFTALKLIYTEYQSVLSCPKNIKALTYALQSASNKVIALQAVAHYDAQEAQIKYIEGTKKRLYITSHIVGMFPSFFHERSEFEKDRTNLLCFIFEDARVQLFNIGYGLYYRAYTDPQDFPKLEYFFELGMGTAETFYTGLCQRIERVLPTELGQLLPVFEYQVNKLQYEAAFYFATGDTIAARVCVEDMLKNNTEGKIIFEQMQPNKEAHYEELIKKQSDALVMFTLDNPFNRYRKLCTDIFRSTDIEQDTQLMKQSAIQSDEKNLIQCFAELSKTEKIEQKSVGLIKKSFFLLRSTLDQKEPNLAVLVAAGQVLDALHILFSKTPLDPILLKVDCYINNCKTEFSKRVKSVYQSVMSASFMHDDTRESSDKKSSYSKILLPAYHAKAQSIRTNKKSTLLAQIPLKAVGVEFPSQKQLDNIIQESEVARKALAKTTAALVKVKLDLYSQSQILKDKEIQETVLQSQVTILQGTLERLNQEALDLESQAKSALKAHCESEIKRDLKSLQEKVQREASVHKEIIAAFEDNDAQQLTLLDTALQDKQKEFNSLQKTELEQAQRYKKEIQGLKDDHTKKLELSNKMLVQQQGAQAQAQLRVLQQKAQIQNKAYEAEIINLKHEHYKKLEQAQPVSVALTPDLERHLLQIESENKHLLFILEQSKTKQAQCQWLRDTQVLQSQSADTKIKFLGGVLEQMQLQLRDLPVCLKVSKALYLEFSGDLRSQLDANPLVLKEVLTCYLQLNKPLQQSDEQMLHHSLAKLLSTTQDLGAYLALFRGLVNQIAPMFSFKKAYYGGTLKVLIPIRWPLSTDSSIEHWLNFVNNKFSQMHDSIDPYYVLNLTLIAPYYALAQTKPYYIRGGHEIAQEIADTLISCLPSLKNSADKVLLKNHIQIELYTLVVEFQQWVSFHNSCAQTMFLADTKYK